MKETSCMVVIPENEDEIRLGKILARLHSDTKIKMSGFDESTTDSNNEEDDLRITAKLELNGREYSVTLYAVPVDIPEFFRTIHFFSDLDFKKIDENHIGLCVEMDYSDNFLTNYHDQLKIINMLVPGHLAVMDVPSEKILSGKWVKLAAESSVPPAPRYIFTVQAITGESDEVWLHTHGLKRCGLPDLEILGSNKEMYNSHYSIIEYMAIRMLENEQAPKPYEPMFLAWLTEDIAMVTTLVDWRKGLEYYPDTELGKADDRDEYHTEYTSVIMLYQHEDDVDKKWLTQVQVFDDYLAQNTMFMLSTSETNRMRQLAQERIEYVRNIMKNKTENTVILLKIGLPIDEQYLDPDDSKENQKEHIWFELKKVKKQFLKELFVCELTQEPYYVDSMHTGDIGKYEVSDITDWVIYTNDRKYTPDDAYLLES